MENQTEMIVVDVRDYFAGDCQHPHGARAIVTDRNLDDNYVLANGQCSGYYATAKIIDSNFCHASWMDTVDWNGCPYPDPENAVDNDGDEVSEEEANDANAAWAEDQLALENKFIISLGNDTVLVELIND